MVTNTRIADLIRENESEGIPEAVEEGAFFDMQSFTQALIAHVLSGEVDREVAANAATNRHDFLVSLEHALKRQAAEERERQREAAEEAASEAAPEAAPEPEEPMPSLRLAGN
jgi:Tfp pilus assembly ATPase PilU